MSCCVAGGEAEPGRRGRGAGRLGSGSSSSSSSSSSEVWDDVGEVGGRRRLEEGGGEDM